MEYILDYFINWTHSCFYQYECKVIHAIIINKVCLIWISKAQYYGISKFQGILILLLIYRLFKYV